MKEIQDKISKLEVVVNSKMIPDSVKAKAKAEIEKLKEELKETKVEEKAEKPKKEVKSKVVGNDLKVIKFFDLTESDWNKMALNERNKLSDSYKEKMKAEKKEPKEKAESKKAELTEKECNELLEKYKAEREARKERAEKREKQGKPAELTPAETAKKAVDRVTDKIEAKAEKGKSVKGDIKAVFNQFKSAVAELKKYKDEIDETEVRNLIKELESLLTKKMADGGRIDLFEDYENIPANVQKVIEKYGDDLEGMDYRVIEKMLKEVEKLGYTFDYGLDGSPYGLRPKGVKITELEGFEDFDEE